MTTTTSFGIELEFIALYPKRLFGVTASNRLQRNRPVVPAAVNETRRLMPELRQHLAHNGVAVNPALRSGDEDVDYSRWTVGTEILHLRPEELSLFPQDDWTRQPIELSSRIFDYRRDNWRHEVSVVLQTLEQMEREGIKFIVNRSTGLHVHVGDGTTTPIALRTAKNVFQFCTAFEHLIDTIHTVPRIGGWEIDLVGHSSHFPLSLFHTRGVGMDRSQPASVFKRLERIEKATNHEQLGRFFTRYRDIADCSGHNSSVNFDNLFVYPNIGRYESNLKRTIEFRQHAGTLDRAEIFAWVEVTCQIVRFCASASRRKMVETCVQATNASFGLDSLLSHLRCSDDVCRYYATPRQGETDPRQATSIIPGSRVNPDIALFLEFVEAGFKHRANRQRVAETIAEKMRNRVYGLHQGVVMGFSASAIDDAFREAAARAARYGFDPESEDGKAYAALLVYRELDRRYESQ